MPRGRVPAGDDDCGVGPGSCVGAGAAGGVSEGVERVACVVVASWTSTAVGSAEGEASVDDGSSDEVGKEAGSGTGDEVCGGSELESTASAVVAATVTEVELVSIAEVVVE